jgi:hypothetical protein
MSNNFRFRLPVRNLKVTKREHSCSFLACPLCQLSQCQDFGHRGYNALKIGRYQLFGGTCRMEGSGGRCLRNVDSTRRYIPFKFLNRRMSSSGMWRRVYLVWSDVSEERIASNFRVEKNLLARNQVGSHKMYSAPHPRRRHSSYSPPWKLQILQIPLQLLARFINSKNLWTRSQEPATRSCLEPDEEWKFWIMPGTLSINVGWFWSSSRMVCCTQKEDLRSPFYGSFSL